MTLMYAQLSRINLMRQVRTMRSTPINLMVVKFTKKETIKDKGTCTYDGKE